MTDISPDAEQRHEIAGLVDELSNRLQVILGYAQILHELEGVERAEAVMNIETECERLRNMMRSLTGFSRDADGRAPWQDRPGLHRPDSASR